MIQPHHRAVLFGATLLLASCDEDYALGDGHDDEASVDDQAPDFVELTSQFFLEVEPLAESIGGVRVPPRTFGPFTEGNNFSLDLAAAVTLSGAIDGVRVTPWFAALPTELVTVSARILIDRADGRRAYATTTDPSGGYAFQLAPDTYRVTVVPDAPVLPVTSELALLLDDADLSFTIGPGAPLWGRVLDASGSGLPDVPVLTTDAWGVSSAATVTDEAGWYELRVSPGVQTVSTIGGASGRDPSLRAPAVPIDEIGARVDLAFAPAARVQVEGRVLDPGGQPVPELVIRLKARALLGYAPDEATYEVETLTDSRGFFASQLPAGSYDLTVLPDAGLAASPLALVSTSVLDDTDLGSLRLEPMRRVEGVVLGPAEGLVADAFLQCVEDGALHRRWETFTGPDGRYLLDLPTFPVVCTVHPPTDALTLPSTRVLADADAFPTEIRVRSGTPIGGTVTIAGGPIAGTDVPILVRVVDLDGVNRGAVTADPETGRFEVQVNWAP